MSDTYRTIRYRRYGKPKPEDFDCESVKHLSQHRNVNWRCKCSWCLNNKTYQTRKSNLTLKEYKNDL